MIVVRVTIITKKISIFNDIDKAGMAYRNIQNQFKRINSSRTIIVKKKGKKDDFSGTLDILVSALGGEVEAKPDDLTFPFYLPIKFFA